MLRAWEELTYIDYMISNDNVSPNVMMHQIVHDLTYKYPRLLQHRQTIVKRHQYDYTVFFNETYAPDESLITWKIKIVEKLNFKPSSGGATFHVELDASGTTARCPVQDLLTGTYIACCAVYLESIKSIDLVQIKVYLKHTELEAFMAPFEMNREPSLITTYSAYANQDDGGTKEDRQYIKHQQPCEKDHRNGYNEPLMGYIVPADNTLFMQPNRHCAVPVMAHQDITNCLLEMYKGAVTLFGDNHIQDVFSSLYDKQIDTISERKKPADTVNWWSRDAWHVVHTESCDVLIDYLTQYTYSRTQKQGKRLLVIDSGALLSLANQPYHYIACAQRVLTLSDLLQARNDTVIVWYDITASIAINPEVQHRISWTPEQLQATCYYVCEQLRRSDILCTTAVDPHTVQPSWITKNNMNQQDNLMQQFAQQICAK